MTSRWRIGAAALVATAALAISGCSSSGSGAASSTAPSPSVAAVCSDFRALQASIAKLTSINVVSSGTDAIKSAVADVQSNLTALSASAKAEWKPEVDALKSSVSHLGDVVANPPSGGLGTGLTAIGTAIAAVGVSAQNLASTLTSTCASASATASATPSGS